jgi:hypothetical protein
VPRLPPLLHRHIPTVIAALLVTTARWWTSRGRVVFHIRPDEPGQLAIARYVGRGARWNMFDHSTWRPAYGTLISPTTWFTDDPATMYRAALGVNAVLGGVSCVLLAVLAARLTGLSRTMCAVLAALAVLAPTVLFTTDWVWSEALVQTTFLVVVLAALRFQDTAAIRWGVVLVLAAALGFATHSRLLPLAALAGVLVVVAVVRRRLSLWRAGALLGLQVGALLAVGAYSRYLVDRIWDDPAATNTAGGVARRLGHVGALGASLLGQVWYQLVVTVGLVGLGAIALARAAIGRAAGRPLAVDARVVLGAVVPLVGLSIVFMTDRWRPDQIVYGRYSDAVMAPVVVAGLAAVVTGSRRRLLIDGGAVVLATAAIGAGVYLTSNEELGATSLLRPMVLGLVAYLRNARLHVLDVTILAVVLITVGLGAVVAARRGWWRQGVGLAMAVVLLWAGYVRTRPVLDGALNSWAGAGAVEEVRDTILPAGEPVRARFVDDALVTVGAQRLRAALYEFYLPENPLYVDGDVPGGRFTPYVFAPLDDDELADAGAEIVWRDPQVGIGLWVEPSPAG